MTDLAHRVFRVDDPLYRSTLALRHAVLREPLGLQFSESDLAAERDDEHHAWVTDDGVIACLSMRAVSSNQHGSTTWKLRQMAVRSDTRGRGIGARLLRAAVAMHPPPDQIQLHARLEAVGFYERVGFRTEGPIFEEIGLPHIVMRMVAPEQAADD